MGVKDGGKNLSFVYTGFLDEVITVYSRPNYLDVGFATAPHSFDIQMNGAGAQFAGRLADFYESLIKAVGLAKAHQ